MPLFILFLFTACSSFEARKNTYESSNDQVLKEVSLKSDREHLKEYRSDVPETVKEENDELAYILSLFPKDLSRDPKHIQNSFNRKIRTQEKKFRTINKRERESFNKQERSLRKKFLEKAKKERQEYLSTKPSKEMMKEFSRKQKEERTDFFNANADRRKDFNASIRERQKEGSDYFRRMRREFRSEYRIYDKKWRDKKREEKTSRKTSNRYKKVGTNKPTRQQVQPTSSSTADSEFDEIKAIPSTPLESE